MKKFGLIIFLTLMCVMLFASCSVEKPEDGTTTEQTTIETTAESTTEAKKILTPEQKKEVEQVEKLVYNLAMAKTRDEIKPCVIQYTDEYADYVLGGFPDDDYIVKAERLVEYKDAIVFNITVTCECDPEYIYSGIQMFSYTEDGELLINLDTDLEDEICKEFVCKACNGQGFTIKKAQTSGGYDEDIPCEVCDEVGFVFDKVTE